MYNPKTIIGSNHRDLESLHPIVAMKAKAFLIEANKIANPLGYKIKIISTLRTWEEQAALYAQGRTSPGKKVTNAAPGSSMHNWGVAFDIGVFSADGTIYNPKGAEAIYKKVSAAGKGVGLFWGGNFESIFDAPHYQYTGKYDNNTFLSLARNGMEVDKLLGEI